MKLNNICIQVEMASVTVCHRIGPGSSVTTGKFFTGSLMVSVTDRHQISPGSYPTSDKV